MYRKNKIINWRAFILCSLLFSCQSRLKIAHSLEELQTKTMLIEEKGLQKYIKSQQVQFSEFQRHKISLLIHYDSTECSTCLVNHLTDMEDLFIISSNTNFEFLPIIVFSPSPTQYEKLVLVLCDNRFSYPIYIDRSNSIRRNNPFLKYHHRYQGFLLDKNDKIVLVGNPIGSDAMWSLFRKTLDNMLANDGLYIPE